VGGDGLFSRFRYSGEQRDRPSSSGH
jgi:hypothetical protein